MMRGVTCQSQRARKCKQRRKAVVAQPGVDQGEGWRKMWAVMSSISSEDMRVERWWDARKDFRRRIVGDRGGNRVARVRREVVCSGLARVRLWVVSAAVICDRSAGERDLVI